MYDLQSIVKEKIVIPSLEDLNYKAVLKEKDGIFFPLNQFQVHLQNLNHYF